MFLCLFKAPYAQPKQRNKIYLVETSLHETGGSNRFIFKIIFFIDILTGVIVFSSFYRKGYSNSVVCVEVSA